MRIRWKLLILLLAISLIPLALVTLIANRLSYHLSQEIGAQAQQALMTRARQQLELLVSSRAALLGQGGKLADVLLRLQAREVERALTLEAPDLHVYFADDFDQPGYEPFDLSPSTRHARIDEQGNRHAIPVSHRHQVFKTPPGKYREQVMDDARRIATITPFLRQMREDHDFMYWQYTSLENGLHCSYPGHGGYPAEYDPRERDWYRATKANHDMTWTPPYVEVSTRQPVLTAAMPVHRANGQFAGVTAIDFAIEDITQTYNLPGVVSSQIKMVTLAPRDEFDPHEPLDDRPINLGQYKPESLGLFVLAESHRSREQPRWDERYPVTWLASDDRDAFLGMIEQMMVGRSGVMEMDYEGQPSLWAYGPSWENGGYLVAIVARDEIVAEAERARATVQYYSNLLRNTRLAALGGASLLVIIVALVGSRKVTRPLRRLAEAAQRIAQGDLTARARIATGDEFEDLARSFNEMVPQLQDRIRIRQSLSLAMEVQQQLLPAEAPNVEGLEIAGRSIYCDETGGDYYDFLDLSSLSENELGIAVGDVTGHGIAAALLMTGARALLRSRAGETGSLAQLMNELNRHLTADTPVGQFMTLFYLVINARHRHLRWVSAGHDPAIVYHPGRDEFTELGGAGIPLGIEMGWDFEEETCENMDAGQVVVIGTDGIWETRCQDMTQFGKERLRDVIRRNADRSCEEIGQAITRSVAEFRGQRPQDDDITLVVVKFR